MESLIDSVIETQHLYRQNAAMKHGVPEGPRPIARTRYVERRRGSDPGVEKSDASSAPSAPAPVEPAVQPAGQKVNGINVPTVEDAGKWHLAGFAAKLIAAASIGALATYGVGQALDHGSEPDAVQTTPVERGENETLLEYLEREGLHR